MPLPCADYQFFEKSEILTQLTAHSHVHYLFITWYFDSIMNYEDNHTIQLTYLYFFIVEHSRTWTIHFDNKEATTIQWEK